MLDLRLAVALLEATAPRRTRAQQAVAWMVKNGRQGQAGLDQTVKPTYSVDADKIPEQTLKTLQQIYQDDERVVLGDRTYTVDKVTSLVWLVKRWS